MSPQIRADITDSMVVEIGSGNTNDSIVKHVEEEKSCDFDKTSWGIFSGDIICSSPWDEEVLFARLKSSELTREHSMVEYKWYINHLLQIIYNVGKPLSYWGKLRPSACELDICELSCPSLTEDSTVSEPPFSVRTACTRLGCSDALLSQDDDVKRTFEITVSPKRCQMEMTALFGLGACFWTLPTSLEYLDLSDTDPSTDSSSEDDDKDDDPFDTLHQAIRQAFSSNVQLAEKVISYLHQLPPDRRAQVYGYKAISWAHEHGSGHPSNPDCDGDGSRARKRRRRANETPSSGSGYNEVEEGDEEENQVVVARRSSSELSPPKRYACGYYKFDGAKYGPRAAPRYKSCGGPGWKVFNHYKRHLERIHLLHQCSRCGDIFEELDELQNHLEQDTRCTRLEGVEREGMSQQIWDELKKVFKKDRRGHVNPSDEERWFRAWDLLFPGKDRPATPYYEKPPLPLVFTQMQTVFEASLNTIPEVSRDSDLQDRIMGLLVSAIDAATRSAPLEFEAYSPHNGLPPAPVPTSGNIDTNQISYIGANLEGPNSALGWDPVAQIDESGYLGNDPFLDMLNLNSYDADADVDAEGTSTHNGCP